MRPTASATCDCHRDRCWPRTASFGADEPAEVYIKHRGRGPNGIAGTIYTYPHHPLDVVGWDGCLYPYAFHVSDFEPITGRVHQPPPVHQVFEGNNFVICNFVPRKVDYHPLSIPVPYYHSNVDSDEIMFYVDGDYEARKGSGIGKGSVSVHPGGHVHGPQREPTNARSARSTSTSSRSWSTRSVPSSSVRPDVPWTTASTPGHGSAARKSSPWMAPADDPAWQPALRDEWLADELDLGCPHGCHGSVGARARDSCGQVEQHGCLETLLGGVQGRGPDAVVGSDTDDVDLLNRPFRNQSASAARLPASAVKPSKPLYAAACWPLRKIASTCSKAGSAAGWKRAPSVPILQCTGQLST
jgi:hypothetical protein